MPRRDRLSSGRRTTPEAAAAIILWGRARRLTAAPIRSHQHRRRLLLDFQARNEGRLSALQGKHLHRYLAEFDFRYSNRIRLGVDDVQRTERAIKGIVGKRLTYRDPRH